MAGAAMWSRIAHLFGSYSCEADPEYPGGRWDFTVNQETPGAYGRFVVFVTPNGGIWRADGGPGGFTAPRAPKSNTEIQVHYYPEYQEAFHYRSRNTLFVSADGCQMKGTFEDNDNPPHHGHVTYQYKGRAHKSDVDFLLYGSSQGADGAVDR
jgi:hypothetical protein